MPPTTSDASSNDVDVIISGIEPCIIVMRTKTLPKKIVFQSSVGGSKTFLLKGREDLNLDERMMQFVDVANLFFKDTLPTHSRDFVKARNIVSLRYQNERAHRVDKWLLFFDAVI
jgi:phosphatidylinositol kinase/protein kinase (PI-3  family)